MSEREYHRRVREWLLDSFANVEHEVYLSDSGRYVDFVAHTPFHSYAIEVEDSFNTIWNGIGQAHMYAELLGDGYEPVVVLPATDVQEPEFTTLVEGEDVPRIVTV